MRNQFQILKEVALEEGIEIKIAKKSTKDLHKQGIHLKYPSFDELHDALDQAQKNGFKTIYIHNANTWSNRVIYE